MSELVTGEWLNLQDAAAQLGLAVDTVRRRIKRGELQGRKAPTQQGYRWEVYLDAAYADVQAEAKPPTPRLDADRDGLIRDLTGQIATLSGQVGFLQAKLQQAQEEVRLLRAPEVPSVVEQPPEIAPQRPWWRFW